MLSSNFQPRQCRDCPRTFTALNREEKCPRCRTNFRRCRPWERSMSIKAKRELLKPEMKSYLDTYLNLYKPPGVRILWMACPGECQYDGRLFTYWGNVRFSLGKGATRKSQLRVMFTKEGVLTTMPRCGREYIRLRSLRKVKQRVVYTTMYPMFQDTDWCKCRQCEVSRYVNTLFRSLEGGAVA